MNLVYVVGESWARPVKIGVASNVAKRVERLQSGNPVTLQVLWTSDPHHDAYGLEHHLHLHFAAHALRGEWFQIPDLSAAMLAASAESFANVARAAVVQKPTALAACAAARVLVDLSVRKNGITVEAAIDLLATDAGMEPGNIWGLLYKYPKDVWADVYVTIGSLLWTEVGMPPFRSGGKTPDPSEIIAVADVLRSKTLSL